MLDARPDTAERTTRPAYRRGDHLVVLYKNVCRDAIVLGWTGHEEGTQHGGRHRIRYAPLSLSDDTAAAAADFAAGGDGGGGDGGGLLEVEEETRDLNDMNHAVQRFTNIDAYEEVRRVYCGDIVTAEDKVEDAITGNQLRIEDQLIYVATQVRDLQRSPTSPHVSPELPTSPHVSYTSLMTFAELLVSMVPSIECGKEALESGRRGMEHDPRRQAAHRAPPQAFQFPSPRHPRCPAGARARGPGHRQDMDGQAGGLHPRQAP